MEQQVPIYSYPQESHEIMHGIGLRLSSHLEHGGETSTKGSCERSAYLAAQEKTSFKADKVICYYHLFSAHGYFLLFPREIINLLCRTTIAHYYNLG